MITFSGCKINTAGTGYQLHATDGTLAATDSNSFNVAVGAAVKLVLSAATTTPGAGAANNLAITAQDAGGNTVTGYSGSKNLTFGGANLAPNGTRPTVTNSSGAAVNFGSTTAITFSNGMATVSGSSNGVMKLYKAEAANITVSDGTITNNPGLSVTVAAGGPSRALHRKRDRLHGYDSFGRQELHAHVKGRPHRSIRQRRAGNRRGHRVGRAIRDGGRRHDEWLDDDPDRGVPHTRHLHGHRSE